MRLAKRPAEERPNREAPFSAARGKETEHRCSQEDATTKRSVGILALTPQYSVLRFGSFLCTLGTIELLNSCVSPSLSCDLLNWCVCVCVHLSLSLSLLLLLRLLYREMCSLFCSCSPFPSHMGQLIFSSTFSMRLRFVRSATRII
jgi:hypothetical protein